MQFLDLFEILSNPVCTRRWMASGSGSGSGSGSSSSSSSSSNSAANALGAASTQQINIGKQQPAPCSDGYNLFGEDGVMIHKIIDVEDDVDALLFKRRADFKKQWHDAWMKQIDQVKDLNNIDFLQFFVNFSSEWAKTAYDSKAFRKEYRYKASGEIRGGKVKKTEEEAASLFQTQPAQFKNMFFNSFYQHIMANQNYQQGQPLKMMGYRQISDFIARNKGTQEQDYTLFGDTVDNVEYSKDKLNEGIDNYLKNVWGIQGKPTAADKQKLIRYLYVMYFEYSCGIQCCDELAHRLVKKTKGSRGGEIKFLEEIGLTNDEKVLNNELVVSDRVLKFDKEWDGFYEHKISDAAHKMYEGLGNASRAFTVSAQNSAGLGSNQNQSTTGP